MNKHMNITAITYEMCLSSAKNLTNFEFLLQYCHIICVTDPFKKYLKCKIFWNTFELEYTYK